MRRPASSPQPGLRPLIWWVIWAALFTGFLEVCYHFARVLPSRSPAALVTIVSVLVAVGFLLISVAIRWLLLPRIPRLGLAFVLFLIGQALAEGCGYIGLCLPGMVREVLISGGALGLAQYVPFFTARFRPRSEKRSGR